MNPFDSGGGSPTNVPGVSPLAGVPVAPREPTPRARALVFGFGPGGRILLIVGIGFLLMGSLFTRIFCRDLPADMALSFAGQKAEGTVRSVETDSHMKVNGRSPKVVTFDYVADGRTHHSTSAVLDGTSPKTGAPVSVEYLSWSADCARIVGTTRNEAGYTAMPVLLFPVVGLLLLSFSVLAQQRRKRAFRSGTATVGRVTSLAIDRGTKVNGRSPTRLSWSFEDARGANFVGSISSMDPSVFGERSVEQPIVVLYDPKNPKVNTLWLE